MSRAGAPQELGLARDPRSLGIALRRIALGDGAGTLVIGAEDARLSDGFHAFEANSGIRWTDGDASLPAALFAGFDGALELTLSLGCATRYADHGPVVRVA